MCLLALFCIGIGDSTPPKQSPSTLVARNVWERLVTLQSHISGAILGGFHRIDAEAWSPGVIMFKMLVYFQFCRFLNYTVMCRNHFIDANRALMSSRAVVMWKWRYLDRYLGNPITSQFCLFYFGMKLINLIKTIFFLYPVVSNCFPLNSHCGPKVSISVFEWIG